MNEVEKCQNDFKYWIEHYCIVKDKISKREIPIKLKDYQINFIKWIESLDYQNYLDNLVYIQARQDTRQQLLRYYKLWKIIKNKN